MSTQAEGPAIDFPVFDDLRSITDLSSDIVVVEVQRVQSAEVYTVSLPSQKYSYLVTPVEVIVTKVMSGTLKAGDVFVVQETGGADGRIEQLHDGSPISTEGSELLLFLERPSDLGGRFLSIGGGSGRFLVDKEGRLSPTVDLALIPSGLGTSLDGMSLAEFERELRAVFNAESVTDNDKSESGTTAPAID